MIGVSKLLCDLDTESDGLRYEDNSSSKKQIKHKGKHSGKPVVVWNSTLRCNLECKHCYASAGNKKHPQELSNEQAKNLIDDLSEYGVPVMIFSGGEPFLRDDIFELIKYAKEKGIRAVISTNGTLLNDENVSRCVDAGVDYIGVSVDGLPEANDSFRGMEGAFESAVGGIRRCLESDIKTGLRYTITDYNKDDLKQVIELLKEKGVDRYCFYHLDYGGKGEDIREHDLSNEETREAIRKLFELTESFHEKGFPIEVLTVGNYVDAPFLYMYTKEKHGKQKAEKVRELLKRNGGDGTGQTIAAVDHRGYVHPNQFWRSKKLGNVKERKFGEIWEDESSALMEGLKNKKEKLKGKCSRCRFVDICGGGSRLRALTVTGDVWKPDPKCYLSEEEIREGE